MRLTGAALALAVLAPRAWGLGEEGPGPLPWRVSGRLGFTVDAAAFPDSAGYTLEVYLRIPPATLTSLGRDIEGATRLRLMIRLKNTYGARQHEAVQEFGIETRDSTGGFGKVVVMRFPTRPGPERLMIKLEDLNRRRHGLGPLVRAIKSFKPIENDYSTIEGALTVPDPQAGRDLSDIEFAWNEGPVSGPSAFTRGDRTLLPDPERLYGLFQGDLHAFFTARAGEERPWRWVARVVDRDGHLVAERESTAAASRWLSVAAIFDLTGEPAGGYDLEVKAWQEGDAGSLLRRSRFSVAWQRDTWQRNPRDIEDNVHFLLSADAEEEFARLDPGEQERYLSEFWRARDPTPETAENEALQTFLQRVDYANRNFGRAGLGRGMLSDMGRVYIRYGAPAEIYRQVIPSGDEGLRQVVGELSLSEDRPVGDVTQHGPGADARPWEVWIYEGDIPLPPDADPKLTVDQQRKRRLVFLFVDENGLGDYRLRYSTE